VILAYHCVLDVRRRHDPKHLVVSPRRFRRHVESMLSRGYEFVTVSEFARRLRSSGPPNGVCALSFDDGSEDNAHLLPRLLDELRVPATLFVCPGLLGQPHRGSLRRLAYA
jgi:peptidoglycan/xylan/chitin deacetylase (PgdA/CDA1 family)